MSGEIGQYNNILSYLTVLGRYRENKFENCTIIWKIIILKNIRFKNLINSLYYVHQ